MRAELKVRGGGVITVPSLLSEDRLAVVIAVDLAVRWQPSPLILF